VAVDGGAGACNTWNTVPVSCAIVGTDEELSEAMRHGGVPEGPETGVTASHEVPFHHSRELPPFKLQSVIVRLLNELLGEVATSKYSPEEPKLVWGAGGFDGY
jgi:hypothetical protein